MKNKTSKQTKKTKSSAKISPYSKLTQTTAPTLGGGQKPKERKNSTVKPGKMIPQMQ